MLEASCSEIDKKYFGENKIESENQSQMSSKELAEDTNQLLWQYRWHYYRSEILQTIKDLEEHYSEFHKHIDKMEEIHNNRKEIHNNRKETLNDENKKEFESEQDYHKEFEKELRFYKDYYEKKSTKYKEIKSYSEKYMGENLNFNPNVTKNLIDATDELYRHQQERSLVGENNLLKLGGKNAVLIEELRKIKAQWELFMKKNPSVSPLLTVEVKDDSLQNIESLSLSGKTNESLKEPLSVEAALELSKLPIKDSPASEQHDFTLDEEQQKKYEESLKKFREIVEKDEVKLKDILDKIKRGKLNLPWMPWE